MSTLRRLLEDAAAALQRLGHYLLLLASWRHVARSNLHKGAVSTTVRQVDI